MKRFRLIHVWLLPAIWLAVALLSRIYGGGENIVLAFSLMPAFPIFKLVSWWTEKNSHSNDDLWIFLIYGLLVMISIGLVLDWSKVRRKVWFIMAGVGVLLAFLFVGWRFSMEVSRSSWARAVNLFDFDQRERVLAWGVFGLLGGVYIGTILALLGTWGNRAYQWWKLKREGQHQSSGL